MKDWTGNRKSTFVTLGASNHTDKVREKDDFYATDPVAVDKLFGSSVGRISLMLFGSAPVVMDVYPRE